ncbi:MAG TPA: AtpZ/AtpI family protein [Pyrinomonadaceae bacterium]|nr:AtpZ/AtpI family protein [Pyrinomonadaceae bacterium]
MIEFEPTKTEDVEIEQPPYEWPEELTDPYAEPTIEQMIDPYAEADVVADREVETVVLPAFAQEYDTPTEDVLAQLPYEEPSVEETARRTGIAYSLGVAFFVSVTFCMLLGWLADWMLGSRPWGLVGGIVLGSIMGFVQFFRMSSQMYKTDNQAIKPLFHHEDDTDL